MSSLDAQTALVGLRPRAARLDRRRRIGPALPLFLAGTLAVATNITGVAEPAAAKPRPEARPPIVDRGKTVREAFADARRAAAAAARAALRATIQPPTLYTVLETDTIASIAARYGLSTASLLALNGLGWSTEIHPGQILKLTASGRLDPVEPAAEEPPAERRHTVAAGESLSAIAAAYGVDLGVVLSVNGFGWSSIIYPGQSIAIPDPGLVLPAPPREEEAPASAAPEGPAVALDEEQAGNARTIIAVGRDRGMPDEAIVIALATAAQESSMRNLSWGDRDSVGLFQQRPSQGWGTVEELTDPAHAASLFYSALLRVPGWESMPLTAAAQAVQISAYPDAYAKWEASARAWLRDL